jgi:hypothetical protein
MGAAMRFIDVLVEEHDEIPEGCCMRFQAAAEPRPVRRIHCEIEGAPAGVWLVETREADGSAGVARVAAVEDSGAGTSMLVSGGALGLRLRPEAGGEPVAVPYLLLSEECIL